MNPFIEHVKKQLGINSNKVLAEMMNVSDSAVKEWSRGARPIPPSKINLMEHMLIVRGLK